MTDVEALSFEQAERELADIVTRLERGDVGVDEAIELWRRGEALHRRCTTLLDTAEGRIEQLAAADRDSTAPE